MSHSKEREEKVCLNCGTGLTGRYCPVCGQENTEPKETVWTLVSHFFNDITHFDGKFFSTVKYLLTKPGFLSSEYLKGRRASYLHPIRMYVFTSAFFFIIFFWLFNPEQMIKGQKDNKEQLEELTEASISLKEKLAKTNNADEKAAVQRAVAHTDAHVLQLERQVREEHLLDSVKTTQKRALLDSARARLKANTLLPGGMADKLLNADSAGALKIIESNAGDRGNIKINNRELDYYSQAAYDSVQKELPADRRDGWFERAMTHKAMLYSKKWKNDKKEGIALFMEKFMHNLPQAMFVSLPVFALILLALYSRRKFYYADHGIFAIHLYCAVFIILLVVFAFDKLKASSGWQWLGIVSTVLSLGIFFYLYKAMRKFYGQGRGKTVLKFAILIIVSGILFSALAALFFFLSVMQFS